MMHLKKKRQPRLLAMIAELKNVVRIRATAYNRALEEVREIIRNRSACKS